MNQTHQSAEIYEDTAPRPVKTDNYRIDQVISAHRLFQAVNRLGEEPNDPVTSRQTYLLLRHEYGYRSPNDPDLREDVLQERLDQARYAPVDAAELAARLRSLTPIIEPETVAKWRRNEESQARREMTRDGCPPCYRGPVGCHPSTFDYWGFPTETEFTTVLVGQASDWRKFRMEQARHRNHPKTRWNRVQERFTKHEQAYKPGRNTQLCYSRKEQGPVETWAEFEVYHHRLLQKEVEEKKLAFQTEGYRRVGIELKVRRHEALLEWIGAKYITISARERKKKPSTRSVAVRRSSRIEGRKGVTKAGNPPVTRGRRVQEQPAPQRSYVTRGRITKRENPKSRTLEGGSGMRAIQTRSGRLVKQPDRFGFN